MISALSILVAMQVAAPSLPAGVDTKFQSVVVQVEKQLEAGNFAGAQTSLATFPAAKLMFAWDATSIPTGQTTRFDGLKRNAIHDWQVVTDKFTFAESPKASLRISFVKQNPMNSESRNIQPLIIQRNGGAVDAVISLTRGPIASPVEANDPELQKCIAQALGTFMGVGELPYGQTVMTNIETPIPRPIGAGAYEGMIASENLAALTSLRKFAAAKTKIKAVTADVVIPKTTVSLGEVFKGQEAHFNVEVTNNGDGVAKLWVRPDCGCMIAPGIVEVAPKGKAKIPVVFNSDEFDGPVKKHLYVISNDPKKTIESFQFEVQINPVATFVAPTGPVTVINDAVVENEVYLLFNNHAPVDIKKISVSGLPIEVSYEPWKGKMADAAGLGGDKERQGYRFHLKYPASVPPGRTTSALMIINDSAEWPYFQYNLTVQKGIAALPENLRFGALEDTKKGKIIVTRPGKPFKILAAESDSPYFTVAVEAGTKEDEYSLSVTYNANAPSGNLEKTITITTDDPNQKTITVTVTGKVQ